MVICYSSSREQKRILAVPAWYKGFIFLLLSSVVWYYSYKGHAGCGQAGHYFFTECLVHFHRCRTNLTFNCFFFLFPGFNNILIINTQVTFFFHLAKWKKGEQRVPFKKSEASNLKRMAAKISEKLLKIDKQCSVARNLHLRRDYSNCSLENGINDSEWLLNELLL